MEKNGNMNHHDFRVWVKSLSSDYIRSNNMNPAHFKAVCFVLSMYGDYASGTEIRPSWLTVAKEASVDRKTAMKVRDHLLSIGILKEISKTPGNISIYELSNLDTQLSNLTDQLSNIDGHNTIIDTTINSNYQIKRNKNPEGISSWTSTELSSWFDALA